MAESTTIYTPDAGSASVNSMLPWLMGNHGGFGGNGWSDLIALLVVWGIFGNNGFGGGFGGNKAALTAMATNNQDLIMQAVAGNRSAISELAGNLNVSINAVQQSLNALSLGIQQVGNQVGMSGLQVINAIQSGNADIASKLASCCCETRNAITTQGFENRLATEVCESIEEMEAEYGGGDYAERGNDSYREGYRRGMEEAEMRRRHGGY